MPIKSVKSSGTLKFSLNAYNTFQEVYAGESDRAVIVLAASFLERYLEDFIKRRLIAHSQTETLFEGYNPLSTFAAKIDMAFCLGLVPKEIHAELHRVRKLRNLCAHDVGKLAFDDEPISTMCAGLTPASGIRQSDGQAFLTKGARSQFLFSVWWVLIHLETQSERTSKLPELTLRFEIVKD